MLSRHLVLQPKRFHENLLVEVNPVEPLEAVVDLSVEPVVVGNTHLTFILKPGILLVHAGPELVHLAVATPQQVPVTVLRRVPRVPLGPTRRHSLGPTKSLIGWVLGGPVRLGTVLRWLLLLVVLPPVLVAVIVVLAPNQRCDQKLNFQRFLLNNTEHLIW